MNGKIFGQVTFGSRTPSSVLTAAIYRVIVFCGFIAGTGWVWWCYEALEAEQRSHGLVITPTTHHHHSPNATKY